MKPEHEFTAARSIAQHCEELFSPENSADDREQDQAAELAVFSARMQRALQEQLAPQLGGDSLTITSEEVGKRKSASLVKAVGPSAANLLVDCGDERLQLLLSFDFGPAQALTEKAFGGDVRRIEADLTQLPRSAWLVLESLAIQIARGFASAGEIDGGVRMLRTHENIGKLDAFGKNAACLIWPIKLCLPDAVELPFRIAVKEVDVLAFLEGAAGQKLALNNGSSAGSGAALLSHLSLPMRAILADLRMPVARLATLKPGDFIPFSPRHDVPLITGSKIVASGRIGATGGEVALNVTKIS